MTVNISHCHATDGFNDSFSNHASWVETEDTNTGTISQYLGDWLVLYVSAIAGNNVYYASYPDEGGASNLGINTTTYTKIYYRYRTTGGCEAKIVLVFTGAEGTQTVLDHTASTTIQAGSADITSGKTIDHIRLHADNATGYVFYDFFLICKDTFTFPYYDLLEFTPPPKYANIDIPRRVVDIGQNLGCGSATVRVSGNMNHHVTYAVGENTWKRSGDYVAGEVFDEIAHRSYTEPWQWIDTGTEQFKVVLEEPTIRRTKQDVTYDLLFRERSLSCKSNETYVERFGLNL